MLQAFKGNRFSVDPTDRDHLEGESGINPYAHQEEVRRNHEKILNEYRFGFKFIHDGEDSIVQSSTIPKNKFLNLQRELKKISEQNRELQSNYNRIKTQYKQSKIFIRKFCNYLDVSPPSFKHDISTIDISSIMKEKLQNTNDEQYENFVLADLISNESVVPHAMKYSNISKAFWSGVGLRSSSTLDYIRNVLKVPTMRTISDHNHSIFLRKLERLQSIESFHLELN